MPFTCAVGAGDASVHSVPPCAIPQLLCAFPKMPPTSSQEFQRVPTSEPSEDVGDEKGDVEMKELGAGGEEEKLGYHEVDLADEEVEFSVREERGVLKKLDRRVVLFVALLYMLSFLDRSSKCALLGERWRDGVVVG